MKTKHIGHDEELRLLEKGVTEFDLSLNEARSVLRSVAEDSGYAFESEAVRRAEQLLGRYAGKRGSISREQFETTAQILRDFSERTIGEGEARRRLKRIMLENGWQPRRGGLLWSRRWFKAVEA